MYSISTSPPRGGYSLIRLQKSRVFFSQNQLKKVICDVRVLRARSARASQGRRERKNGIFSVSPQSRSLFSASFQTFCLTARAYLNTQKYGLQSTPLYKLYRYVPPHRAGFSPILVWNQVWFSKELRGCMNVFIVSIPNEYT